MTHRQYMEMAHNRYLKARRVNQMISGDVFGSIVSKAGKEVEEYIANGDHTKLEEWINRHRGLEDWLLKDLRALAHRLEIPYYTTLNKADLILRITHEERTSH